MTKENTQKVLDLLFTMHKNPKCELDFSNNFELICAVILSAQCTDKRVNLVTPALFHKYPTPKLLASADLIDIENIIKPCGFYHNKAKSLKNMAKGLMENFNGEVPNNINSLQSLSGVGRKTANVVYAVGFNGQAIAVDTHVFRVSNRIGLANSKNVLTVEKQLMKAVPQNLWTNTHHALILHGRYICKAIKPNCTDCLLKEHCKYYKKLVNKTKK